MTIKRPVGNPITLPNGITAPFSPAFRAGEQLFVSGQLAFNEDGSPNSDDIRTQTQLCLSQIERILEHVELSRKDIVRVGIWLTNADDFAEFNEAYAEFFSGHRPARACVISQLALPGSKVEIDAIAAF